MPNETTNLTQTVTVCRADELPEGEMRLVETPDGEKWGVFNCGGELRAIEDRCSHDNGDLADGELYPDRCAIECPRHGSLFDLRSGRPKTLPAYQPVRAAEARVEDGEVKLDIED